MDLPRKNRQLDEIFKNAAAPESSEFEGEYFVDMLTGLPSLRIFSHRKIFYRENEQIRGYNLLFEDFRWGCFFIEQGKICELDSRGIIIINYDRKENSFISGKVRDYIRCLEKNRLHLGRFNYILAGKPRFLGYFSLKRKNA